MIFDRRRTLKWVNEIRISDPVFNHILKELPGGTRRSVYSCPIANAIEADHVDGYYAYTPRWPRHIHLPRYVQRFIRNFDKGRYPDLVEFDA